MSAETLYLETLHSAEFEAEPERRSRPLRIVALPGSLRRASYNRYLLAAAQERTPDGMSVTLFDDLASIPLFNEDLDDPDGGPEGVRRLRAAIAAADGLLIATPEYNQSIPGVLKNALDWLSLARPDAVLEGKPVAVMGITTGAWGTRLAQRTLRQVLFSTESLVLTGPAVYLKGARELFADDGRLTDSATQERLSRFLEAFGEWIETMSPEVARRVSVG